jgi:hypothetical protein
MRARSLALRDCKDAVWDEKGSLPSSFVLLSQTIIKHVLHSY